MYSVSAMLNVKCQILKLGLVVVLVLDASSFSAAKKARLPCNGMVSDVSTRSRATVLVGTRSRLIRLSTSDGHVRCTACGGSGTPARPASHVRNAYMDVLRRTRRNAYTIRGGGPDVTIERPAEVRAGARPYQIRSPRLNRSNFFQKLSSLG